MDKPQKHRPDDGVVVQLAQEQALRRLQSILEENHEKRINTICFPDCLFNCQILNGSAYYELPPSRLTDSLEWWGPGDRCHQRGHEGLPCWATWKNVGQLGRRGRLEARRLRGESKHSLHNGKSICIQMSSSFCLPLCRKYVMLYVVLRTCYIS